jgi:hypothetical protein
MVKLHAVCQTALKESCKDAMDVELDIPLNVTPSLIRRCCDSRSTECCFAYRIEIDNPLMSIDKVLCLYAYKRK